MKKIEEIRRQNLLRLKNDYKTIKALAEVLDRQPAQVSQWLNATKDHKTQKPRNISSSMARTIETKCGKPEGWLDVDSKLETGTSHIAASSELLPFPTREELQAIGEGQASWSDVNRRIRIKNVKGSLFVWENGNNYNSPQFERGDYLIFDTENLPSLGQAGLFHIDSGEVVLARENDLGKLEYAGGSGTERPPQGAYRALGLLSVMAFPSSIEEIIQNHKSKR